MIFKYYWYGENMEKKIDLEPYINYDGILSDDERKRILDRIESAFSWLGATIPKEIEIQGKKYKLQQEIQNLILNNELTDPENDRITRLISHLENEKKVLTDIIKKESIADYDALELSNRICGILRAVHDLRGLAKRAYKVKAFNAKQELMDTIDDEKRWLKYVKKIK